MSDNKTPTGAENVLWDLSGLYKGLDDPQIEADLETFRKKAKSFERRFKGKMHQRLGDAIRAWVALTQYEYTLYAYPMLLSYRDQTNQDVKRLLSRVSETINAVSSKHMGFLYIEISKIKERDYQWFLKNDTDVLHHQPLLDNIREASDSMMSEEAEKIFAILSQFTAPEWVDLLGEMEADLQLPFEGKMYALPDIFQKLSSEPDAGRREQLLRAINLGLETQKYAYFYARGLNVIAGEKAVLDILHGYRTPISASNEYNQVDDATVEALHKAVRKMGVNMCKRYYRLCSKQLNGGKFKVLKWSDAYAPLLIHGKSRVVSWQEATQIVEAAYRDFSPTLADLIVEMLRKKWVDAPYYPGKASFALNYTFPFLNGNFAYTMLNYDGSKQDIMFLAHEVGHGVHGLLSAEAQGPLMCDAPTVYAETASVFGEMLAFNYLLAQSTSDEEKLSLLMHKLEDFMSNVVHNIHLSTFEQKVHSLRHDGKLTHEDFKRLWMETVETFYGKSGEVFEYDADMMGNMWCLSTTLLDPFYAYSYAFGELFTQSLFAVKDIVGDDFELKYLELLKAGNTKDAVKLMKPFGLNPDDAQFWQKGMIVSVLAWLQEAERLTDKIMSKN